MPVYYTVSLITVLECLRVRMRDRHYGQSTSSQGSLQYAGSHAVAVSLRPEITDVTFCTESLSKRLISVNIARAISLMLISFKSREVTSKG